MELGLLLFPSPTGSANMARMVEGLGFRSLVFADTQCLTPEVWSQLMLAASATERIEIGTGVTNPVSRDPSVTASAALGLQVASGGRAVLGIVGEEHTSGCRVKGVAAGLGAMDAGIQEGDVITKIDDKKVDGFQRLTSLLAEKKAGDKVRVELLRGDKTIVTEVALKSRDQIDGPRVIPPFRLPPR